MPPQLVELIHACFSDDPQLRPGFEDIVPVLLKELREAEKGKQPQQQQQQQQQLLLLQRQQQQPPQEARPHHAGHKRNASTDAATLNAVLGASGGP